MRMGPARSASISPAVGVLKTTSGTGWGGGGRATSTTVSVGAAASAIEFASIQGSAPSRRRVPATLSQWPASMRELMSRSNPFPRGRTPLTQIAASADCRTKSHRPFVPALCGRSASRFAPRNRPVMVTPFPMYRSGARASARRVGSSGRGDGTALAPRIMNTWSRAGHWPPVASSIGWKLTPANRGFLGSSRPTSQNSPRTSLLVGALGESRQKTNTGLDVFASRIKGPAGSTSRRTTICFP